MDPVTAVGLVASVAQLIGAVATLVTYVNDVKDAPKERARLAREAASLLAFLTEFRYGIEESDLEDPRFSGVRLLAREGGPLESFAEDVKALLRKLKPATGPRKIAQAIKWPLDRSTVDKMMARIERLKTLISVSRQEDHFRLSLRMTNNLAELKEGIGRVQKDRERQEVVDWISSLDFSKKQHDCLSRCQGGTGAWFLGSAIFKKWLEGTSKTLWCYGQRAGKTILTSLVINYLEHEFKGGAVAYVYCNFKQQDTGTADLLISSLLRQLVQKDEDVLEDIISLRTYHWRSGTRPTLADWTRLLQSQAHRFSRTFIVIDALDECSEVNGTRDKFMAAIRDLQPYVHLLITSRYISSIENELGEGMHMEISASNDDIRRYLQSRIQMESRLTRLIRGDQDLQATIISSIVNNAKGMFLLAQLQMDSVAKKNNRRDIRRSLANLPKELNDTYDEAMRRIWGQGEEDIKLAERLLSWIVFAYRPLKLAEIQHALAVERGDIDLDEDSCPEEDFIISACAGLVTVDLESDIIRLVHHTAQEYFEYARMTRFPYAQVMIAETCLTYLSFNVFNHQLFSEKEFEDTLRNYPLAVYAAQYWGDHARGNPEEALKELALAFLRQTAKATVSYQIMNQAKHGYSVSALSREPVRGLHIASGFGLAKIVQSLLELGDDDPNSRDPRGDTPLSWAASNGHDNVVRHLLNHQGVNANVQNSRGWTPLAHAAAHGHAAVVKVLLQRRDLEFNPRDTYYGETPLWRAADRGHKAVVELLLSHPLTAVNSRDMHFGHTPLWRAVENGYAEVVRLFLERPGVDRNITDNYGQTLLQRAIEKGDSVVLQLLLVRPPRLGDGEHPEKCPEECSVITQLLCQRIE